VLLCRPRCFAVVSLLALSLLTAFPAARAGTYAFSGYTLTPGSGSAFTSYGGTSEHFSVVANDKITAAFTWQPTNGDSTADPPPSSAIIQQTSSVSWTGGVTGMTPPAGQGSPFTVTATQKVTVQVPTLTAYGTGSYMQVNTKAPHDTKYELWGSMDWTATFHTPTSPAFGAGTIELVQIATSYQSDTTYTKPPVSELGPDYGSTGMDYGCPYNGQTCLETAQPYASNDNPGQKLTSGGQTYAASASDTSTYTDYIMYMPPGADVQWVPLASFKWSTNGSATLPSMGNWSDYMVWMNPSDSAGTVDPHQSTPFTRGNTFPSWTRINVFPSF